MLEFVVVLETTSPDGEPWEQVISPRFTSELKAAAWRKENELPRHCRVRHMADIENNNDALASLAIGSDSDVEDLKRRWYEGDVRALLEVVQRYGFAGVPIPDWCWFAFHDAAVKLSMYEVRDLNEAFGFDPRKRGRLADRNRQARLQWTVFLICEDLKKAGKKVSPDMFDEAAAVASDHLGIQIGKTTAEKYYYSVNDLLKAHAPD